MELSEFAFKIILVFLPGLLTYVIIDYYTIHKKNKVSMIIIFSFLLGFLDYLLYYPVTLIPFLNKVLTFSFIENLTNNCPLDFKEIFNVSVVAVITGLIISKGFTHKWFYRFGNKFDVSRKIGPLWNYLMDLKDQEWIILRDIKNDIMYEGWICGFSDNTENLETNELFLRDVKVCRNSDATFYYSTPALYIVKKKTEMTIDYPYIEYTDININSSRKEKKN